MRYFQFVVVFVAMLALFQSTEARHIVFQVSGEDSLESFRNILCEPKKTTTVQKKQLTSATTPNAEEPSFQTPSFHDATAIMNKQLDTLSEFNDDITNVSELTMEDPTVDDPTVDDSTVDDSTVDEPAVDVATESKLARFIEVHSIALNFFALLFVLSCLIIIRKLAIEINHLRRLIRDDGRCKNCKASKMELCLKEMDLKKPKATPSPKPKAPPAYEQLEPPTYDNIAAPGVQIHPPAFRLKVTV